jgi:hypothetical protein
VGVRESAGEEIGVAADLGVETAAPQRVVQQQGQDVHAAVSGGPPGHRVSPGVAGQAGIEELVERLGRVFLGVASPGVVPGIRVPPSEPGREERVSSERVQAVLDRMALRPGRVQQFVNSSGSPPAMTQFGYTAMGEQTSGSS